MHDVVCVCPTDDEQFHWSQLCAHLLLPVSVQIVVFGDAVVFDRQIEQAMNGHAGHIERCDAGGCADGNAIHAELRMQLHPRAQAVDHEALARACHACR